MFSVQQCENTPARRYIGVGEAIWEGSETAELTRRNQMANTSASKIGNERPQIYWLPPQQTKQTKGIPC